MGIVVYPINRGIFKITSKMHKTPQNRRFQGLLSLVFCPDHMRPVVIVGRLSPM